MLDARTVIMVTLAQCCGIGDIPPDECAWEADSILRALDAAGYTPPLPKVITEKMMQASLAELRSGGHIADIWRAMVAAAGSAGGE